MDPPYQPFKSDTDVEEPFAPSVQNPLYGCETEMNLETTTGNSRVRLRAIESESDYFLKSLNTTVLRTLCLVQMVSSILIILCQVLLYATVTKGSYYKAVDFIGIGLWAPLFFFIVAVGLTYLCTKKPSGCIIGTAMGFQISSAIVGCILLILSVISLVMHGRYSYYDYRDNDRTYDPEVPGRVFCSIMILCSSCEITSAIFVSIHFCRGVCCGRNRIIENVMFDVETVKI